MFSVYTAVGLAVVLLLSMVFVSSRVYGVGSRPSDIPPGPPTIPILGNLHQVSESCKEAPATLTIVALDARRQATFATSEMGARIWVGRSDATRIRNKQGNV